MLYEVITDIVVSKTGVRTQELQGRPTFAQYAQDMRNMGGLRTSMPWTWALMRNNFV